MLKRRHTFEAARAKGREQDDVAAFARATRRSVMRFTVTETGPARGSSRRVTRFASPSRCTCYRPVATALLVQLEPGHDMDDCGLEYQFVVIPVPDR